MSATSVNQFIHHSMLPWELRARGKVVFPHTASARIRMDNLPKARNQLSDLSALAVDLLDTILRERARRIL